MRGAFLLAMLGLGGGAQAQSLGYAPLSYAPLPSFISTQPATGLIDPSRTYFSAFQLEGTNLNNAGVGGYLRLSDVIAASGGSSQPDLSNALVSIAARLDRFAGRFREGIALAGAMNVLPPNPGDRFAVSFGGAGYDGAAAGSVAVSARIREDIIVYGAAARGPTQTLVKGGVGFSFR